MYSFFKELFSLHPTGNKKRITTEEMRKIMSNLYGKLDEKERIEVEKLFSPHLNETGLETGITRDEYDATIAWLKANQKKHVLEDSDIAILERYFVEHLQD